MSRTRRNWIIAIATSLLLLVVLLLLPLNQGAFASHPIPAQTFDEATSRIHALQQAEMDSLVPPCRTRFLSHEARTARVIVFVHGYTSCPEQFAALGQHFFDAGHNVLIVPLPLHGLPDRMTEAHAKLRARELVEYADEVVDIARGLGQEITVAGLSAGGLVAAWAAQNRADVDLAVLISPVLGYAVVPPSLSLPAARLFALIPDKFEWWDAAQMEKLGPEYSYPRYSRHALAQLLKLASAVVAAAGRQPPAAREILVVTNPADDKISAARIETLVSRWKRSGKARVDRYEFPLDLGLGHDIIDPNLADQDTSIVYPRLVQLMTK